MSKDKRRRISRKDEQEELEREEKLLDQVKAYKKARRLPIPPPGKWHNSQRRTKRRKTTREYLEEIE